MAVAGGFGEKGCPCGGGRCSSLPRQGPASPTTFGIWARPRRSTSGGRRGRSPLCGRVHSSRWTRPWFPELAWGRRRARMVVLAAEVGSRWSVETANFWASLARTKAQAYPHVLQERVQRACIWRWSALLVCSAVIALTASLQDRRPCPVSGIFSMNEVVCRAMFV